MRYFLVDLPHVKNQLLPLTYTRPVCELRVGILTIHEKWSQRLGESCYIYTTDYLSEWFTDTPREGDMLINGSACPNESLLDTIRELKPGEALFQEDSFVAAIMTGPMATVEREDFKDVHPVAGVNIIERPWHIFQQNASELKRDFQWITQGRTSQPIHDPHTRVYGEENVFLEEGVKLQASLIDATSGPVYFGKNTVANMGAIIRGSFAMLDHSVLNMGAKMRGDTTIGPWCKVGGEVGNSVIMGYSNKGHEGYLGNSVIGQWCNLGADTNTSNMKNDYSDVRLWDYQSGRFARTGSTFCGLMMGDHSKSGINVMFNSGTSVGVGCNVYNSDYLRNFIPSFYMGDAKAMQTFPLKKALQVAERVMDRRNRKLTDMERGILEKVFEISAEFRKA